MRPIKNTTAEKTLLVKQARAVKILTTPYPGLEDQLELSHGYRKPTTVDGTNNNH